ncbi:adenylate kinase [uncultured Pseudoflavonifractor sp.]|uniref:adenylate kinase n=1 Tax=uncultured Pseudoflavonifractor sp. TaxID=1221379 RepID=UPI0025EC2071|nr:adenylate kinase [uncultured Pseudoflavonifractor sp.]
MKLILLGAPGAGKGTQAEILSKKLGIPTISTGNILRAAVKAGTSVGLKAKSFMDAGKLVPDDVILDILEERLAQPDCNGGYILDGVPRTIAQAEALEKRGIEFDHVISLEVSDEDIVKRMDGRRVCSQCGTPFHIESNPPKVPDVCDVCGGELIERDDDKPETVRHRLEIYHQSTEPLKDFYQVRGKLNPVPGAQGTIEATTQAIVRILEA